MQQDQQNSSSWTPRQTPRLDKATKAHVNKLLRNAVDRQWCKKHGKILPPPKLPPVVLRVIKEWFLLVDDDGSGTLEHHELLAALQAARIPCDAESITEMIKLMDANCDGCISWDEFEKFMMNEFAAGQQLLSGEFVLPSGTALPFGAMVRQLKRNQMMKDVTEGGEARTKWMHFDVNITADAAELARAEEAIRIQKEYNDTLHLHVQHQHQQQMLVAATLQQWQHKPGPGQPAPRAGPATAPAAAAKLSAAEALQAAAAANGFDSNGVLPGSTLAAKSRPGGVPRLNLGSISGSGATQDQRQHSAKAAGSTSSRAAVGFLTEGQTADLLSRLPADLDLLIGSPRFAGSTASTARTSRQLPSSARLGSQQPTARSARGAAEKYAGLCKSARAAAAAASVSSSGDGSSSTVLKAGASGRVGGTGPASGKAGQPAAVQVAAGAGVLTGKLPQGKWVHSAASSARRPYSASTGQGKVQPQPSRDEWRAVAASCLTQRHAAKVCSPRTPAKACQGGSAVPAAAAVSAGPAPAAASTTAVTPAAAAAAMAAAGTVSPPTADAAAAASARTSSGGRTRLWENPSASLASTSARTQRVGASGLLSAGAAAVAGAAAAGGEAGHGTSGRSRPSLAACYGVTNSTGSSSPRKPHAGPSIQRATAPAAAGAPAAAAAVDAEQAPPSNDDKNLFTPRTGRGLPAHGPGLTAKSAAATAGAVNSPRLARQAAAAGAVTHRPLSSPQHKQDRRSSWQHVTQKQPAAASPRVGQQQQQQQRKVGLQYRQSSGSSCSDSRGQCDTSRSSKGKTPRHGDDKTAAAATAAAAAAAERQPGNVLDASCKYLLSACAVPPAALLSPKYVGPVEAAVIRAHTPRHRA